MLENRARDVIEIDGETDGRIVVEVDRARISGGVFDFAAKVRGKRRGSFNIHGTVVALMKSVRFRPE